MCLWVYHPCLAAQVTHVSLCERKPPHNTHTHNIVYNISSTSSAIQAGLDLSLSIYPQWLSALQTDFWNQIRPIASPDIGASQSATVVLHSDEEHLDHPESVGDGSSHSGGVIAGIVIGSTAGSALAVALIILLGVLVVCVIVRKRRVRMYSGYLPYESS